MIKVIVQAIQLCKYTYVITVIFHHTETASVPHILMQALFIEKFN